MKSAVQRAAASGQHQPADIAASFQQAVIDCLVDRTARALEGSDAPALVVAGGVAANRPIRAALADLAEKNARKFAVPPGWLCTDNAAMIAWAGAERLAAGLTDPLDAPARARWPLDEQAEKVRGAGKLEHSDACNPGAGRGAPRLPRWWRRAGDTCVGARPVVDAAIEEREQVFLPPKLDPAIRATTDLAEWNGGVAGVTRAAHARRLEQTTARRPGDDPVLQGMRDERPVSADVARPAAGATAVLSGRRSRMKSSPGCRPR